MNNLEKRNSEIAEFIGSLTSGDIQVDDSFIISMGGITDSGTNVGTNCGSCTNNIKSCKDSINAGACKNYSGYCSGTQNGGDCLSTDEKLEPPVSLNPTWPKCP